jgi:hypothetical protein
MCALPRKDYHLLKTKSGARNQINIKEVKDGVLILPNNKYRIILEASAVNFELKSEEEQDQITDTFQNFLNALPCPVQILIRTREVDIDGYLEDFMAHNNHEKDEVYKVQLKEYGQFIKKMVSGNKILTRKFYLVLSNEEANNHDFSLVKEQLRLSQDIVSKCLERLGMKTRQLGNLEVLNLFYSFYNPSKLKTQPLSDNAMEMLLESSHT